MRSVAVPLILIGAFGLNVSSYARDVSLGKHTAEEVKSVCEKVGGRFSQDATGHYCSTDCHGGPGTDCVVGCKTGLPCVAQVIGSRRPTDPCERAASALGQSALVGIASSRANFDVCFTPESGHAQTWVRRKDKRDRRFCDLRHRRHRPRNPTYRLWAAIARRGIYASSAVRLRAFPCCLPGGLSRTPARAARRWRRSRWLVLRRSLPLHRLEVAALPARPSALSVWSATARPLFGHRERERSKKGHGEDGGKSIGHRHGHVPRWLPNPNQRNRKHHDCPRHNNNHNCADRITVARDLVGTFVTHFAHCLCYPREAGITVLRPEPDGVCDGWPVFLWSGVSCNTDLTIAIRSSVNLAKSAWHGCALVPSQKGIARKQLEIKLREARRPGS